MFVQFIIESSFVLTCCITLSLLSGRESSAVPRAETPQPAHRVLSKDTPLLRICEEFEYRYRALRNTDPALEKRELWYKLRSDLHAAQPKFRGTSLEPRFQILRPLVIREIALREANQQELRKVVQDFHRLADAYPNDEVAPRALFAAYEILVKHLGDKSTAEELSSMLLHRYPSSEQSLFLRGLEGSLPTGEIIRNQKPVGDGKPVIVLDPGHGGEDYGAVGVSGLREKDLTLLIAKLIQEKLLAKKCCEVILTREADVFVPLFERTKFANGRQAKLFVSLHINSEEVEPSNIHMRTARGFEVYSVSQDAKGEAITLVTRENRGSDITESTLSQFLTELHRRGSGTISRPIADMVFQTLKRELPEEYQGVSVIARKASSAPFYVLFGAEMPAILVELFFISDLDDAFLLGQEKFREQIANSLAVALSDIVVQENRER